MENFFFGVGTFFSSMWSVISTSWWFMALKIFAGIYTVVLVIDVALLAYLGDVQKRVRQLRRGTNRILYSPRKVQKMWKGITARLATDDSAQWKLAVLEADHLVDKELAQQGYHGDHFMERLAQVPEHAFTILDDVRKAHVLRNRIIHDEDYELSHEDARQAVETMKQFLADLGVGMK